MIIIGNEENVTPLNNYKKTTNECKYKISRKIDDAFNYQT